MKKFVYLDNVGYEKIWTWKFVSIIEKWINTRWNIVDFAINYVTALVLTLWYIMYVLYTLWYQYIIFFIVISIIIILFTYQMNKGMLSARKERVTALNVYVKYLVKIIMSKYETMQVWLRSQDIEKLDWEQDKAVQANRDMQPYIQLFFWVPALLFPLLKISLFLIIGLDIIDWVWSYTDLVAAWTALWLLENLMWRRLKFYKDFTKDFDLVKRMRDTFDEIWMIEWYDTWNVYVFSTWDIEIKDMCYSYDQEKVFDSFSLHIQWWKKTALVWVSWSGKSTLVKLIAGYLRPSDGKILVDQQDLAATSLQSYYSHIWYLTQDPWVFDWSILENLTYATEWDIDNDLIDAAIVNANCEFIYDLQDGVYTEIGERWIRLSWWQKQRLAIAKIFLRDPKIIILDEPTSALDSFSEEAITKAMNNLFEGRTVIIIAHRLQTVKQADTILLLDDWKIAESWTHAELVNSWGHYAKMLELQSGF